MTIFIFPNVKSQSFKKIGVPAFLVPQALPTGLTEKVKGVKKYESIL